MAHYIGSAPPLQRLLEANCRTGALHREAVRPKTERTLSGTDRRRPPAVPAPHAGAGPRPAWHVACLGIAGQIREPEDAWS